MSHPSFQTRRKRHLPHVQRPVRSRPPGTFWLTYSRAVDWLRRNHGVIDKALELLEIYPTLIQEMSLDGLWDFIAPFFSKPMDKHPRSTPTPSCLGLNRQDSPARPASRFSTATGRSSSSSNSRGVSAKTSHKGITPTGERLQVPVISITYASDEQEPELQALSPGPLGDGDSFGNKTPRIYLCYLCNHRTSEEKLHRHVLHALQHDFYVRSGPCADDRAIVYWDDISEADVCVFVLDDLSLNKSTCFKSLCAAWSLNLPVVFLKDSRYSLPVPLPDIILQHNLGLESPELSRASTPEAPRRSTSPVVNQLTKRFPATKCRSASTSGFRYDERAQHRKKQNLQDSDMVLQLLNGYRNALVFEEDRHRECEEELRETVHKLLSTGRNEMLSRNVNSRLVPKSSNALRSGSRKPDKPKRLQKACLGVPKLQPNDFFQQERTVGGFTDYASDEDNELLFLASPSEMNIDICSESNGNISPENFLFPHSYFQRNNYPSAQSRSNSPPPARSLTVRSASPMQSTSLSVTPSGSRCGSSLSFVHLHQFQQQLQQDRALFLSSVSPTSDSEGVMNSFQERQTVYMVCNKPNKEPPRLVKYPPSSADAEEDHKGEIVDMLSDTSDSPVSFRNVDLSTLVNKPLRGSDTPDSDASFSFF